MAEVLELLGEALPHNLSSLPDVDILFFNVYISIHSEEKNFIGVLQ